MSAPWTPEVVAVVVCLVLVVAIAALAHSSRPASSTKVVSASTPSAFAGIPRQRVVAGVVAGMVVLLASRWLMLGVIAGLLVIFWGRLLRDDRADEERRRLEGIAKWLEDLRDTLRGSSIGAEDALEQVALRPPDALAAPMHRFVLRRRQGFRTEEALADLADDLAHPTADAAIAAICLVVGGTAGAGRLHGTVQALAAAARDEVTARERIDRTRAVYHGSMKRLVVIGVVLVGYLRFAAGDLLQPYDTPVGQVVLLLPLGMWVGCVLWLRSLCRYDMPRRYRIVPAVGVTQ